eukprot:scaffold69281_cov26-Tisochrysis_lutea.AAC.5
MCVQRHQVGPRNAREHGGPQVCAAPAARTAVLSAEGVEGGTQDGLASARQMAKELQEQVKGRDILRRHRRLATAAVLLEALAPAGPQGVKVAYASDPTHLEGRRPLLESRHGRVTSPQRRRFHKSGRSHPPDSSLCDLDLCLCPPTRYWACQTQCSRHCALLRLLRTPRPWNAVVSTNDTSEMWEGHHQAQGEARLPRHAAHTSGGSPGPTVQHRRPKSLIQ